MDQQLSLRHCPNTKNGRPTTVSFHGTLPVAVLTATLMCAASGWSQTPPVATTAPATEQVNSNSTLHGWVNPNGTLTTAWFEWGITSTYGNSTPPVNIGSGPAPVELTATLTNLMPGVGYHYRLVATNLSGRGTGWDMRTLTPRVVLNGSNPLTTECHAGYVDPGAMIIEAPLAVSAGYAHNLALKADSTVVGWLTGWWGSDYGQVNPPAELSNVVSVAAGAFHSLALKSDGTVVAWGAGSTNSAPYSSYNYGQSVVPPGLTNAVAIAAGYYFSLALKADGTVVAWGSSDATNVPPDLRGVTAIAAGEAHGIALKSDGTVVGWGGDRAGETNAPDGLGDVIVIAAGGNHSLALKSDGTLVGWGALPAGFPVGLSNLLTVAAGAGFDLAVKADGTLLAWGSNNAGETNVPAGLTNVAAIAAGVNRSFAVQADGTVFGWGNTYYVPSDLSNLGRANSVLTMDPNVTGAYTLAYTATNWMGGVGVIKRTVVVQDTTPPVLTLLGPNPLTTFVNSDLDDPGVIATDTCAGDLTEAVQTFGTTNPKAPGTYTRFYSVKDPSGNTALTNRTIIVLAPITLSLNGSAVLTNECHAPFVDPGARATEAPSAIAAGYNHSLVLRADGSVVAWGDNSFRQISPPGSPSQIVAVAGGYFNSLALYAYGSIYPWGDSAWYYGYGGDHGLDAVPYNAQPAVAIAAGGYHNMALKGDGTIVEWSTNNYFGELDNYPVGLSNVVAIAAGGFHSLALKGDGTVVAWGDNSFGQTSLPAELTNVMAISAGGFHNLGLKRDGTVVAWGYNGYGQADVPTGLSSVTAIAAGEDYSLALKSDGTVLAWGDNSLGETSTPAGLSDVIQIAAGAFHCLALKANGEIVTWGDNSFGQRDVPKDLDLLAPKISGTGSVNAETPGTYSLGYSFVDWRGSSATTMCAVVVVDTTPPMLYLQGTNPMPVLLNSTFTDPGAYAWDSCAGGIPNFIVTNGVINTTNPGIYTLTYTVTDPSGNTTNDSRTVVVAGVPSANTQPASAIMPNSATMNASINPRGPTTVYFMWGTTTNYTHTNSSVLLNGLSFLSVSNTLSSLLPNTRYHYCVAAENLIAGRVLGRDISFLTPDLPTRITSFVVPRPGQFQLQFSGAAQSSYSVLASTNLTDWTLVGTATETSAGSFTFLDSNATNAQTRFYRIRSP